MELLTRGEAAKALKVSVGLLDRERANGRGPAYVRICSAVRYPQKSLDEYVQANLRQPMEASHA